MVETFLAGTEDKTTEARSKASTSSSPSTCAPISNSPEIVAANSVLSVSESPVAAAQDGIRILASPYAEKLAKELNVDLSGVVGSGPTGRIVAKDVEAVASTDRESVAAEINIAPKSDDQIVFSCSIDDNAECC